MPRPMTADQITETLCRLAAEQVGVAPVEVTPETHLFQDLNFDSLNLAEYAMEIEDAFEVSIPDDVAGKVRTVADAIAALQQIMGAAGRP